ncbi:hypothetical protein [Actinorhabdospora filicis]|nr:hypothetical protein [Actinorhabdospora filicis]
MAAKRKPTPTDRQALLDWWTTLAAPGFTTLPPPGIARQTPAEAEAETHDLPPGTSYAYWLAPGNTAFTRAGTLTDPLPLHWHGDHTLIRAALGPGPAGYAVTDGGPHAPFTFDLLTPHDADGLPHPDDRAGVRQLLARLHPDTPLTAPEHAWLHDRLRDPSAPTTANVYIGVLDDHGHLTRDDLDRLLATWRAHPAPIPWYGWQNLVRALLRADHPQAWDLVEQHRQNAARVLTTVPSQRGLDLVRSTVLDDGNLRAIPAWLRLRQALHEPDETDAAAAIATELQGHDQALHALDRATNPAEAHPDLTAYEGTIGDIWHRYRTLTPTDTTWLKARIADPTTTRQGLAVCLELLYAHGQATTTDLDALTTRWKTELAKNYRTTYTEWRHPIVTLTCLAHTLDHPLTAELDKWWTRPTPKWKDDLLPLTWLATPTEDAATRLWTHATSGAHDTGHLLTWVLLRAHLDDTPPRHIAAGLIGHPGVRDYVLKRVLIAATDPAQPLWHYDVDPRSWSWWRRAVELADDPELPEPARALARKIAADHYLLRDPDQVTPTPTPAEIVAAATWAKG